MLTPLNQKRIAVLLTLAFRAAPLILVIEAAFVTLGPPISVFGTNPLREWIATHLFSWLGYGGYHLAGALTDFKKMVLYTCFFSQLFLFKAMTQPHASFKELMCSRLSPTEVSLALRLWPSIEGAHKRWLVTLVGGLLTLLSIAFVFFVIGSLWLSPSTTDHVFGPIGKGLVSSWFRQDITLPSHFFLVAYRLWYVAAGAFVGIAAASTVYFTLLRAVELLLQAPEQEPNTGIRPPQPWMLTFCGAPLLTFSLLCLLLAINNATGIGEVTGRPLDAAVAAVGFLITWIMVAAAIYATLARKPASAVPVSVRQLSRAVSFVMASVVLFSTLITIYAAAMQPGAWGGVGLKLYAVRLAAKDVITFHFHGRMDIAASVWAEMEKTASGLTGQNQSQLLVDVVGRLAPSSKPAYAAPFVYSRENAKGARNKILWDFRDKVKRLDIPFGTIQEPNEVDRLFRSHLESFDQLGEPSPSPRRRSDWTKLALLVLLIATCTTLATRRRLGLMVRYNRPD